MKKNQIFIFMCTITCLFLSAADEKPTKVDEILKQAKRLITPKATPAPTPPPSSPYHSPSIFRKTETFESFPYQATQVGIHNSQIGGHQNLEIYLHGSFRQMREQIRDDQSRLLALSELCGTLVNENKNIIQQLNILQAQVTKLQGDYLTLAAPKEEKPILVKVGEIRELPLNEAWQERDQKYDEKIDALIERQKTLEAKDEAQTSQKTIFRRMLDRCIAFSLIATGVYHYGAFSHLAIKAADVTTQSTVASVIFPHLYIPASLMFISCLASDIYHAVKGNSHAIMHSRWERYTTPLKTVAQTAAYDLYDAIKPVGSILVSALAINLLLTAHAKKSLTVEHPAT